MVAGNTEQLVRQPDPPQLDCVRTPCLSCPGFTAMLKRIEGNGVRTIIVETASRFARDLMVQEVGHAMLKERGIELIAADSPTSFIEDTPTARLIRQVLGAVSEFDKEIAAPANAAALTRARCPNNMAVPLPVN